MKGREKLLLEACERLEMYGVLDEGTALQGCGGAWFWYLPGCSNVLQFRVISACNYSVLFNLLSDVYMCYFTICP